MKTITFAVMIITLAVTGCSSNPAWAMLGQTLLTDLGNGTALNILETIIASALPALAADLPAIDAVLQAFISLFETLGDIPVPAQPSVNAIKTELSARAAAAKKSGYVMPAETERLVERVLSGQMDKVTVGRVRTALIGAY
jgi:hypothetical protein